MKRKVIAFVLIIILLLQIFLPTVIYATDFATLFPYIETARLWMTDSFTIASGSDDYIGILMWCGMVGDITSDEEGGTTKGEKTITSGNNVYIHAGGSYNFDYSILGCNDSKTRFYMWLTNIETGSIMGSKDKYIYTIRNTIW